MDEKQSNVFRKETLDRISSPEQLTEYLRVTNPGIWAILIAVMLLLAGFFVWAAVGTLETNADATVVVQDHTAQVVPTGTDSLEEGMPLHVAGKDSVITSTDKDKYGRSIGTAEINLPDGTYSGTVVVDQTRPIDFLLTSD